MIATTAAYARISQVSEYVNTLMLQDVLDEPAWLELLTPADRRGLTPLFGAHVLPYGEVRLDMSTRLAIGAAAASG